MPDAGNHLAKFARIVFVEILRVQAFVRSVIQDYQIRIFMLQGGGPLVYLKVADHHLNLRAVNPEAAVFDTRTWLIESIAEEPDLPRGNAELQFRGWAGMANSANPGALASPEVEISASVASPEVISTVPPSGCL